MTTLELRDWHARQKGWTKSPDGLWRHDGDAGSFVRNGMLNHPIPATLDAAAECLPEGWTWTIEPDYEASCAETRGKKWVAWKNIGDKVFEVAVNQTGDEIRDRLDLARLCLIAQGATP